MLNDLTGKLPPVSILHDNNNSGQCFCNHGVTRFQENCFCQSHINDNCVGWGWEHPCDVRCFRFRYNTRVNNDIFVKLIN